MTKQMKLKGVIRLAEDGSKTFHSTLHDGTSFSLLVTEHDVELNDVLHWGNKQVEGWLFVVQEAKQDSRCYLTLPKPTINYGKQILVHELQLMPRNATIADFRPQRQGGAPVKVAPVEEEVAAPVEEEVAPVEEEVAAPVEEVRHKKIGRKGRHGSESTPFNV